MRHISIDITFWTLSGDAKQDCEMCKENGISYALCGFAPSTGNVKNIVQWSNWKYNLLSGSTVTLIRNNSIYRISSRKQTTRGGPPTWGLGVGLTTPHRKKEACYEKDQ
jgi:hypothetical protein